MVTEVLNSQWFPPLVLGLVYLFLTVSFTRLSYFYYLEQYNYVDIFDYDVSVLGSLGLKINRMYLRVVRPSRVKRTRERKKIKVKPLKMALGTVAWLNGFSLLVVGVVLYIFYIREIGYYVDSNLWDKVMGFLTVYVVLLMNRLRRYLRKLNEKYDKEEFNW